MPQDVSNTPASDPLGLQMVIEMRNCRAARFDDMEWIETTLVEAAVRAKATIVDVVFHKFNPIGISGVVVIAESHLAIHTWPEHRYAAIDIFTCGTTLDGNAAVSYIAEQFASEDYSVTHIPRGFIDRSDLPSLAKEPAPARELRSHLSSMAR